MVIRLPDYDPILEYPQWKAKYFPDPEPPPPPPPPKPMWEDREAMWARYKELVKANTARAQAIYDAQELALAPPPVDAIGDAGDATSGDGQGAVTDIASPVDAPDAASIPPPIRLAANDTAGTTDAASALFSPTAAAEAPLTAPEPVVALPEATAPDTQTAATSASQAPGVNGTYNPTAGEGVHLVGGAPDALLFQPAASGELETPRQQAGEVASGQGAGNQQLGGRSVNAAAKPSLGVRPLFSEGGSRRAGLASDGLYYDAYGRSYDPKNPQFHHNIDRFIVCRGCDPNLVYEGLKLHAAPGQDGPVREGKLLDVKAPVIGRSAGPVVQVLEPETRTVHNVTQQGHVFEPGYITRSVVVEDGNVIVVTEGVGTGKDRWFNQHLGPSAFTLENGAIVKYVLDHDPGADAGSPWPAELVKRYQTRAAP
jgi:hypothetical protein